MAVDVGAEAVLARGPEALTLMTEVGLDADVENPATTSASIWSRGDLHPLPKGTLLGIPSPPSAALGILSPDEVARAEHEEPWPGGEFDDVSLGDYVATRLGDAVVDRLVEPLLGGVYAGQSRSLSLRACVPTLFEAVSRGESLTVAARAAASDGAVLCTEPVARLRRASGRRGSPGGSSQRTAPRPRGDHSQRHDCP